jgi:[ribosomal protein S5]-alanine N-acetyltransferase
VKPRLDPTIQTARLTLRPPRASDADDIVAGVGDPAVAGMLARVPLPYAVAQAEDFVGYAARSAHEGRNLILAVDCGRLVGIVSIEGMPRRCELGYWLARPVWGRGFATEAAGAVLAYGFGVLGLKLIRSTVNTKNRASLHVQQKLGFATIGRSMRHSLARAHDVACIDTVLPRARFQALAL